MSVNKDTETRENVNEETPLLIERQPDPEPESEQEVDEEPKQTSNASWYLWRIFWFIIAALLLALFIKGWIDAGGDVDVGVLPNFTCFIQLIMTK